MSADNNFFTFDNLKLTEEEKHFGIEILESDDESDLPDMPVYPIEYKNLDLPDSFDDLDQVY